MTQSDPVCLALRAAIEKQESAPLYVALASRLLELGDAAQALSAFEHGLRLDPADSAALHGAARAADALGDSGRAAAYRLAAGASQGGAPAEPPRPGVQPIAPPPGTGSTGGAGLADGGDGGDEADDAEGAIGLSDRQRDGRGGPERGHLRLVSSDGDPLEPAPPPITFADVAGMKEVKQRLGRAFLVPLRNPGLYEKFGKSIGGGFALYGPPGCGKTFLARALAGEVGARFINVGLSDVLDMWFGESERKLHAIFENARRQKPAVVFFDEVDALGQRRSHLKGSAGRNLVNQLLSELDGFAGRNDGVFFLGATNHPWDLDPALRRPGRFDRLIFVPPPDVEARAEILRLKLAGRPLGRVDLEALARKAAGFSGADLEAVVNLATELAIEASVAKGAEVAIDDKLLQRALSETRPSTRAWFETARHHAVYANEGGAYDELLAHLKSIGLG